MIITIIFIAAAVAIAVFVIIKNSKRRKRKQPETTQFVSCGPDFSVSEYLERMEKYGIEIMQERQESPHNKITLWVGLDGLRLNDDGTTEWIRRKEKKQTPISVSRTPCQSWEWNTTQHPFSGCQNITGQIDSQIRILQLQIDMQLQNCRIQQQMLQSQQIMNAIIHPPYIPAYSTYFQSAVTQCCAKPFY